MGSKGAVKPLLAAIGPACVVASPALAIDLAGVPGKDMPFFHPGQSNGHTAGRFHHVSLENSPVIDQGTGDFVAVSKSVRCRQLGLNP